MVLFSTSGTNRYFGNTQQTILTLGIVNHHGLHSHKLIKNKLIRVNNYKLGYVIYVEILITMYIEKDLSEKEKRGSN